MASDDTDHCEVERPRHYSQGGIEPIDFIESHDLDFRAANIIKYVVRAPYKGTELKDYTKARYYLDRIIQQLHQEGIEEKMRAFHESILSDPVIIKPTSQSES